MGTTKMYFDSDGNRRTLYEMINCEPEWSVSRIKEGERALEVIEELIKLNPLRNDRDAYLHHLCEYGVGRNNKPNPNNYGLEETPDR